MTPSSLICGENGTVLAATLILEREGRDAARCLVSMRMTSDLLGFKVRPLKTEPCNKAISKTTKHAAKKKT